MISDDRVLFDAFPSFFFMWNPVDWDSILEHTLMVWTLQQHFAVHFERSMIPSESRARKAPSKLAENLLAQGKAHKKRKNV